MPWIPQLARSWRWSVCPVMTTTCLRPASARPNTVGWRMMSGDRSLRMPSVARCHPGQRSRWSRPRPHCRNGLSRRPRMSRAPGRLREMASNSATGLFKVTGQSTRGRRSECRATSISIPLPEGIPTQVFRDLELHAWRPMPGRSGLARRLVFDFPGNPPVFFRRRNGSAKRRVSRGTSVTSTTSVLARETFWRPRCSSHR